MDEIITRTARGDAPFKLMRGVIRGLLSLMENSTHAVLSVINMGVKKRVPPIENELLMLPAFVLAEKIREGQLTSEAVVKAYTHRIGQVNGLLNAVVGGRYQEAVHEARMADQLIQSGSMSLEELAQQYPLLGVPFTAKEAILIKGLPNTGGLVCREGMTADEDNESVQRLRQLGAIPLAVTNTSEVCVWWETYNNLWGRTNNPYDLRCSVGGSSGGEAALLSAGGSIIGLGTDFGGSIRLPSFYCGIFGHKPSQGYVPTWGQYPPAHEEVCRYASLGPMARYFSDLKSLLRLLVGPEGIEKLKLDEPVDLQSIKVYYMFDDGDDSFLTTPASTEVKETIQKVVDKLSKEGLVTQEIHLKNIKFGFFIWLAHLSEFKEQRIEQMLLGNIKSETRRAYVEMGNWFSGKSEHTFPALFNACAQEHLAPLFSKFLNFMRQCGESFKDELFDILDKKQAVFLCPSFPYTAKYHGALLASFFSMGYNTAFNAVPLPTTQCPLGLNSDGMPTGVQIVAGPSNDRLSLRIAEHLEKAFGGWVAIRSNIA